MSSLMRFRVRSCVSCIILVNDESYIIKERSDLHGENGVYDINRQSRHECLSALRLFIYRQFTAFM